MSGRRAAARGGKARAGRDYLLLAAVFVLIPLTLILGSQLLGGRRWYFLSMLVIFWAILPFFVDWERRRPGAREITLLAALIGLTVAARVAFYLLPHMKPVLAMIIVFSAALGARFGFLLGALVALISNFLFGQGPWTLWQMFAWGLIGCISGLLMRRFPRLNQRLPLAIFGFLAVIIIHGGITNPAGLMLYQPEFTWQGLLAAYALGLPLDIIHALATAAFLFLFAPPLNRKLSRLKNKYGLLPD